MLFVDIDVVELSKAVSHALRHAPEVYGLTLDPDGWVEVRNLIQALIRTHPAWQGLSETHLAKMVMQSNKRRHEIAGDRIRALYGHSTSERLRKEIRKPPELLYHGTDPEAAKSILSEGLKPMDRQYAHLSADTETALQVGKRKCARPVILVVNAMEAFESGTAFYVGSGSVWLADYIPPVYISAVPVR